MAALPPQKLRAFTLIEVIVAVFLVMMVLLLAMPSLVGAFSQRALDESFSRFDELVREAQQRAVLERKAYQIAFEEDAVFLIAADSKEPVKTLEYTDKSEVLELRLPFAAEPNSRWTFWNSGNCEPALIHYEGDVGTWTASYDPMTTQGEITESRTK